MPIIASEVLMGGGEGVFPRERVESVSGLDERCLSCSAATDDTEVASVSSYMACSLGPSGPSNGETSADRFVPLVAELVGMVPDPADPRLQTPSRSFCHARGEELFARAMS